MKNYTKIFRYIYKFIPSKIKENIRNIYNKYSGIINISSKGNKKALVIYLKSPFKSRNEVITHCNVLESFVIRDELIKRDYSIDIIDYRSKRKINYSKYDLIFGFGDPFGNSFSSNKVNPNLKRICYSTGAYPDKMNTSEEIRINSFNAIHESNLKPQRNWNWKLSSKSFSDSDGIIHTGNKWTSSTFDEVEYKKIFTLPVPTITKLDLNDCKNKDVERNYIFFSGAGAVYKGLDLVIDAFKSINTKSNLYIYGPFEAEKDFMKIYKPIIDSSPNIYLKGIIDPMSEEFSKLMSKCSFSILPSCCEAGASSVITTMHRGLIPIVTTETSIDLVGFGIKIESLTINSVKNALLKSIDMKDDEIRSQKSDIIKHIVKNHMLDSYKRKLNEALNDIL